MRSAVKLLAVLSISLFASVSFANDIYITQSGDNLDLDITQDGTDNVIGTTGTAVSLTGDDMSFDITQTGSYNTITAVIKGDTYTGTWDITGDSNEIDLLCSSTTTGSCDTVTLNVTATGDDNDFTINIGETSDSDSATVAFTVTGDNNIINSTLDGTNANITVALNNSASLSTNSANSDEGVAVTLDIDGNGDSAGHTVDLDITGGGGTVDVTQSGIYDNTVDLTISGDDFDVDISQSD
tara:strand:- start:2 stop:721 length:720 start_codon:yes stop_codon:yes gene_type:complete